MRRVMIAGAALLLGTAAAHAACDAGDINGVWVFYAQPVNCVVEFVNGGKVANGVCHYKFVDGPKSTLSGSIDFNKRCEITGTLKEKLGKKTQSFTVGARVKEGRYALTAEGTTQTPAGVVPFFGVKQW